MQTDRFTGRILGVGSTSGVRVVVGRWDTSPWGAFSDVMLAQSDGARVLLAPDEHTAAYVSATYSFDEVVVGAVEVGGEDAWAVRAPGLSLRVRPGRRAALGWVLRAVPRPLATAPAWTALTDPVARRVQRGVRTRGSAGHGREEFYGAYDLHTVVSIAGAWRGRPLGAVADVSPEPGFGFGSTPERPGITSLVTTVRRPD